MSDLEKKALEQIEKAEKKLVRSKIKEILLSVFGRGHDNTKAAVELYQEAAALLKITKQWAKAGETYRKMADLQLKKKYYSYYDASMNYTNAANCYKKNEMMVNEAVSCMEKAIELNLKSDQISSAARNHQSIAEALEHAGDLKSAISNYEKAADYFQVEDSPSEENAAIRSAARNYAMIEDYEEAIKLFEDLATSAVEKNDGFRTRQCFFSALICHLCMGVFNCEQALEKYDGMCGRFGNSSDHQLLTKLFSHVKAKDVDEFDTCLKEYENGNLLDGWSKDLFDRVRKTMTMTMATEE